MPADILLLPAALLLQNADATFVNDSNAAELGINMQTVRSKFLAETGREILTNETIKVRFDSEGQNLDFSTFDSVGVRVQYELQHVSPNKGEW